MQTRRSISLGKGIGTCELLEPRLLMDSAQLDPGADCWDPAAWDLGGAQPAEQLDDSPIADPEDLTETDGQDESPSAPPGSAAAGPTDLAATYFIGPTDLPTGFAFGQNLTVQIANVSNVDVTLGGGQYFSVGVYLSPEPKIETWDIKLGASVPVYSLQAGQKLIVPFDTSVAMPVDVPDWGAFYVGVLVDEQDVINEVFESNNSASQKVTVERPDLKTNWFASRSAAGAGQNIADATRLKIANQSSAQSGGFVVRLECAKYEKLSLSSDRLLTSAYIGGLKPWEVFTLSMPSTLSMPTGLTPGQYYLRVRLDAGDSVLESKETNNVYTHPIEVTTNTWTVLAYLDGDNDRESCAMGILDQLEMVPQSADVHIVALLDRHPQDKSTKTSPGNYSGANLPSSGPTAANWSDTRRGFVTYDGTMGQYASKLTNVPGQPAELNMGDQNTLTSFLQWGMQAAPAQHYMLIIYDHGGGFYGIAYDWSSTVGGAQDRITMAELRGTLDAVDYIDVTVFDACLMQQAEVVTEMVGEVGYVVGGESVTYSRDPGGSNFDYPQSLPLLSTNPTARALAREIYKYEDNRARHGSTVSVLDVTGVQELNERLDNFAQLAIAHATAQDWGYLRDDRHQATVFHHDSFRDLRQYMSAVMNDTRLSSALIRNAAKAVYNYLAPWSKLIVDRGGQGCGLSIFLPETQQEVAQSSYFGGTVLHFANPWIPWGTHWGDFVSKFPTTKGMPGLLADLIKIILAGKADAGDAADQPAVGALGMPQQSFVLAPFPLDARAGVEIVGRAGLQTFRPADLDEVSLVGTRDGQRADVMVLGPTGWQLMAENVAGDTARLDWDSQTTPDGWYRFRAAVEPTDTTPTPPPPASDQVLEALPTVPLELLRHAEPIQPAGRQPLEIEWDILRHSDPLPPMSLWLIDPDGRWTPITAEPIDPATGSYTWYPRDLAPGPYTLAATFEQTRQLWQPTILTDWLEVIA